MEKYEFDFTVKAVQTKFGDNTATNDIRFIVNVGQTKLERIMGDSLKVAMRSSTNRETAWNNNGKSLTVMVDDRGLTVVDPTEQARIIKELTRKQYIDEMVNPDTSPARVEELRQLIREL